MEERSKLDGLLKHNGIKPSHQRRMILSAIYTLYHPSADEVYAQLIPYMQTLSRTTVYSTLDLFCEVGLLTEVNVDSKLARYDINTHKHGHFICEQCNTIYDFDLDSEEGYEDKLPGFKIRQCQINVNGICKNCLNNLNGGN